MYIRHRMRFFFTGIGVSFLFVFMNTAVQAQTGSPDSLPGLLTEARTTKGFDRSKPVTEAQMEQIIAAGTNAPSAMNSQPWFFSAVIDGKLRDEIAAAAGRQPFKGNPGDKPDAENKKPGQTGKPGPGPGPEIKGRSREPLDGAPAVIVISGKKDWRWSVTDSAIACEAMSIAAQSLGLGTHIVAGPAEALTDPSCAELRAKLGIPPDKEPLLMLLAGYPADESPDAVSHASGRTGGNYLILK